MTNAQQSDILLDIHALLKAQQKDIKKLKKKNDLATRNNSHLQQRVDLICDSLDELSRRTLSSDFSSAELSSALSLMSSKARSGSSDSLDSNDGPDSASLSSRPSTINFSPVSYCDFDKNNPSIDIQTRQKSSDDPHFRSISGSSSIDTWTTPNSKKKKFASSLRATATNPPPSLATDNPFSPLDDDSRPTSSITTLTLLGSTRSPSKIPAKKKLRSTPLSPDASPIRNAARNGPLSPPRHPHASTDHDAMICDNSYE
jgi:hypothetical protein